VAHLALPHVAVQLVGHEHHDHIAAAGGVHDRQHLESLLARGRRGGGSLTQTHEHLSAGVLEIERVRVPLGAVADDGHSAPAKEVEVCVVVVEHRECAGYPTGVDRSFPRASLPEAVRGSGSSRSTISRGTLNGASARAQCSRRTDGSGAKPGRATTSARTASPHRSPTPPPTAASTPSRW